MTKIIKILLVLTFVAAIAGCGPKKVHSVKIEAEANTIIDVLNENKIKAEKQEQGEGDRKTFDIMVENPNDASAAIQVMEDHCLGRPEPPEPEGGPVVPSVEVERARAERRMKMNIESQLRRIPGVVCADINFVPPEDKSLALKPYPSTAWVSVYYKTQTFPFTKEEIASAVARSVPNLQPENVTVFVAPRPLRPLAQNETVYNVTRIALVSGIGLATVLLFVSVAFVMRKRKKATTPEPSDDENEPAPEVQPLLNDTYEFDDDDEDDDDVGR